MKDVQCSLFCLVPVPAITVTVTLSGNAVAGGSYTLDCSAMEEVAMGLTGMPSLQWLDSPGDMPVSGMDITVGTLQQTETTAMRALTFNPIRTSLGGNYTCVGTLQSPAVEDEIVEIFMQTVNVASKQIS